MRPPFSWPPLRLKYSGPMFLCDHNCPQWSRTQIYRFALMIFKEKDKAMVHGANERASIDNLNRMIKGYAQLMKAVSND